MLTRCSVALCPQEPRAFDLQVWQKKRVQVISCKIIHAMLEVSHGEHVLNADACPWCDAEPESDEEPVTAVIDGYEQLYGRGTYMLQRASLT